MYVKLHWLTSGPVGTNSCCAAKHCLKSHNLILNSNADAKVSKDTKYVRLFGKMCIKWCTRLLEYLYRIEWCNHKKTWSLGFKYLTVNSLCISSMLSCNKLIQNTYVTLSLKLLKDETKWVMLRGWTSNTLPLLCCFLGVFAGPGGTAQSSACFVSQQSGSSGAGAPTFRHNYCITQQCFPPLIPSSTPPSLPPLPSPLISAFLWLWGWGLIPVSSAFTNVIYSQRAVCCCQIYCDASPSVW